MWGLFSMNVATRGHPEKQDPCYHRLPYHGRRNDTGEYGVPCHTNIENLGHVDRGGRAAW